MYHVFLDKVELPIAPGKIELKIKNKNKTVTLLNEGEVNLLKKPGLTDINFKMRIPHVDLPFARDTQSVDFYLSHLEDLKVNMKIFPFIVVRGDFLYDTSMMVTLEDYTIDEDSKHGPLTVINIKLKQFRDYKDIKGTIKEKSEDGKTVLMVQEKVDRISDRQIPPNTTVREGESLWDVVMRMFGTDVQYDNVKRINNITDPNNLTKGMVIWSGHVRTSNIQ